MANIKTIAFRNSSESIGNLQICIDNTSYALPDIMNSISGQYNVRCVFEKVENRLTYSDSILGELINQELLGKVHMDDKSDIRLLSPNGTLPEYRINMKLQGELPVEIITIYFYFSETKVNVNSDSFVFDKYFGSYDYLGFCLVDLPKMKEIIIRKYGNRKLDLIDEFSNTELIDELFEQGIIIITWGIHPYSYPIYSTEDRVSIRALLGREFCQEGLFRINEDIKELSLIPGYALRNWPELTQNEWTKISLYGKGEIVHLTPYILEDPDFETVSASFLIHRSEGHLKESIPLLNVNLLYE